ncbi:MAG: efflux RND transporter periplasmic adaptor subunit [Firmicutes bacterium]|nr:efflux RND transporter periplasmic adaptor subunit [Bacillota bacterium]
MTDTEKKQFSPPTMPWQASAAPKRRKKLIRIIIIAVLVIGLLVGGFFWWQGRGTLPAAAQNDLTEFTVTRGNVIHTVSGPGTVSPVKIFTIATNLTGDILEDYFEEGDEVDKDALLFTFDSETTSLNFDAAKDTLANAQDSYQSAVRNKQDLATYAQQGGVVNALYVKKGDHINSGSKVAEIIDTGNMLLTLPFNSADTEFLWAGEAAVIYMEEYDLELEGYVRRIMSGHNISSEGALITNVEIVFANPGAIKPGAFATAIVGDYACNDIGQIDYALADTIYAAGSGKIVDLTVSEGDRINAGQKILILENSTIEDSLSRAAKNVSDAETKLTNTQNNLQIKSPIAGTVLTKSAKAGDTLYNTSTTLGIVADMSCLIFSIDVDELEIRYVQSSQQVTVTADAYEGESFAGIVTNVSKTGTSSSGITTYPVTIEIAEYGGLLPGMNVNADIVVREAINVLYIPVDAVSRGNLVLIKDDGLASEQLQLHGADENSAWPIFPGGDEESEQWPPMRAAGDTDQQRPIRGNGQGGQQWSMRGDDQGEGGQFRTMRDDDQQRTMREDNVSGGQMRNYNPGNTPAGMGFMGAQAPEGFIYRRVETGISDSKYVEIISGLNEGDIVAYRPSVRDSGNTNFMFMGPGMGFPSGGDRGGAVIRQVAPMQGGK